MSLDLLLMPTCSGCGSASDLYGSSCKHMTLCLTCGKRMAENCNSCFECGVPVTRLIREYPVRAVPNIDKNYFIGRFVTGLPNFYKKKNTENKWTLQKDGLQGRQITETLKEKFRNKPWLLEDETGQFQYHGHLEGSQVATYYLLVRQGKEFHAIPAGSWYNFNKVAQYKQLTLEEAEEKMKNRRKTADGYERWMMKAATNGPAAFGEVEKLLDDKEGVVTGGKGRKKTTGDEEEGNASDKGEEDEEEEAARKSRLGLNKRDGGDDEEGPRRGDLDFDDDDIEKGDDWEHEEIFTDDDEAVGNDPEERGDLDPEAPAPPEIKQDEEDEDEENEEGGLSKSGKELKKLLGKAAGLDDSDSEDDDDDDDDEDDDNVPPIPDPKQDILKKEPAENNNAKPSSGSTKGTCSPSKSAKSKRKANGEETKAANGTPSKKGKMENATQESKPAVKEESLQPDQSNGPPKKDASSSSSGPVTEDEIRAVLMQNHPVTTQDLVNRFKARLRGREDKNAFAAILRRISRIQKTKESSFIVLRDR